MALWNPPDVIGQNEHIGRRLFARQSLAGATDQQRPPGTFELYHFEEKRDREVSFDRLGASSVDRKVKAYLDPRAHAAGKRFHKPQLFFGWAVASAKKLRRYSTGPELVIVSSPTAATAGDELTENKYHAHADMPPEYDGFVTAMYLKTIFEANYCLERSSQQTSAARQPEPLRHLWDGALQIWRRIQSKLGIKE